MSDDYELPELPSDEDLGIADLSEEDLSADAPPPRSGGGGAGGGRGGARKTAGAASRPSGPAWLGVATLVVLILGAWLGSSQRLLPTPRAANAGDDVFSSARAMTTVVEMARRPHPPGSPEHGRVRGLVVDRLTELGLAPEVHTHLVVRSSAGGGPLTTATVRNVVARVPGTASTGTILLMAHYDGRTLSRGAGDDATGVAAILETLRAVRAELPLDNDLLILLTDAEELGLLGARAYVDEHLDTADVKIVVNHEMRGGGGPAMMFETGADNGWAVQQLAQADPHPAANSIALEVYRRMPNDTDYSPFRDAGVQGLNSAAIGRGNVYHQSYDDPAHLDEATLQHHGARLLALTRHLGQADLTDVEAPDRGYLVLPGVGLVHYPLSQVPLGAGVLALAFVVVGLVVVLRGGSLGGAALGSGAGAATVLLSAAGAWGIFTWVKQFHPEFGALHGAAFHEQGPYLVAAAALALTVGSVVWSVARRWAGVASLALGHALFPVALALALAFTMPGAAAVFAGPAAVLLASTLLAGLAGRAREGSPGVSVASALAAVVSLLFLVSIAELVTDAMTLRAAAGIGALLGLTVVAIAPALEGLAAPNRWWAPVAGLVVAVAATGAGVMRADPDPLHPAPSTLVYVQDQGGPNQPVQAWWVGADDGSAAWAEARTGSTFDAEIPATPDYGIRGSGPAVSAPAVTLAPLQLRIVRDTVVGAGRRVGIGVPRPRRPESVLLRLGEGAGLTALDTVALPPQDTTRPTELVHHGAPRDSLLVIEVELPLTATAVELTVQEELQRPWEVVDSSYWERDETLAPNIVTFSDRAVIRSFHRILLQGADPVPPSDVDPLAPAATDTTAAPPDTSAATPPDTTAATPPDTAATKPTNPAGSAPGVSAPGGRR